MDQNDKKTQILDAAEMLFAKNGFEGTSVRDIAKEADVNVAMISYYFGSKEKLLQSIFECRSVFVSERIDTIIKDTVTQPLQKIYQMIDLFMAKIFDQSNFHKIMVREQMINNKDAVISSMIHESKKRNQEKIRLIIHEGQKKGVFKKNIDIPLMMTTLVGTTNQLLTTQHFYREINNLQDMPEEEFQKHLRKRLSLHLKTMFKAILTYEADK